MQITGEMMAYIVAAVAALILAFVWLRRRPSGAEQARADAVDAATMSYTIVMAAEQLWRTGKLPADERFAYAMSMLAAQFPSLDTEVLRATIEAGVYWLHSAHDAVGGAREPQR